MRLLRWAVVLSATVMFVWFAASVKVGHRTLVGHLEHWAKTRALRGTEPPKPSKVKAHAAARPALQEEAATEAHVKMLENAARAASVEPRGAPSAKTPTDERLSAAHKKALDEIVSSRVTRR